VPEVSSSNAADVRGPLPRSRCSRWIPAAGVGAAVLVLAAAAAPTLLLNHRGAPATAAGRQPPAALAASPAPSASTTADQLRSWADAINAGPADAQSGPYTYRHIRRWILDTTGTPARRGDEDEILGDRRRLPGPLQERIRGRDGPRTPDTSGDLVHVPHLVTLRDSTGGLIDTVVWELLAGQAARRRLGVGLPDPAPVEAYLPDLLALRAATRTGRLPAGLSAPLAALLNGQSSPLSIEVVYRHLDVFLNHFAGRPGGGAV
jgi:hypothetical protein